MGLINLYKKMKLNKIIGKAVDNPELLRNNKWWENFFKTLWRIREVRVMLAGYKTYVIAALTAIITIAHSLGYIDEETFQNLLALLAAGGTATVAAKINRVNKKVEEK